MSDPQFSVKAFARGVKLTTQHVWTPAQQIQTAAQDAQVQGQEVLAPFQMAWTFTPQSETFGSVGAAVLLPMAFPPPQQEFDTTTRTYAAAPQLVELSIAFDQRANPGGIVDEWQCWPFNTQRAFYKAGDSTETAFYPQPGQIAEVDLSRYDTVLKLLQKVPTALDTNGDSDVFQEILTLDLPGSALFGTAQFNPYVIDGLSVYMNPYGMYYWSMETPGLAALTGPTVTQKSALLVTGVPSGAYPRIYDLYLYLSAAPGIGDTYTINSTGGGPYTYIASLTDKRQDIIDGLLALAAADTVWTFTDATVTRGSAGLGHILATHIVPGGSADVITTAASAVTATFTTTLDEAGAAGNILSVVDDLTPTHTYTYALLPTDTLYTAAAGLAAAINLQDGYLATSVGAVVQVENAAGVSFAFTQGTNDNDNDNTKPCFVWFSLARPLLAMPNMTLAAMFKSPLAPRDYSQSANPSTSSPYVQNIPTKHLGKPSTGTMYLPAPPAADAIMTGDDWQDVVTALEAPLLNGLRSGYGRDPGSEADVFPWEQLANDAGYQVINVQMFPNWWDVRRKSIDPVAAGANTWQPGEGGYPYGVGFPYLPGAPPYVDPVCDQRILRVPTGFVLHHVLVCQNNFPHGSNRIWDQGTTAGELFSGTMKVGVALYNGLRADDLSTQQVAYLEWTDATAADYIVDELKLNSTDVNYRVLNCPLVATVNTNGTHSYGGTLVGTGKPVWMGPGNSTTQGRTPIANMPVNFGGVTNSTPGTKGGENLLLVRWSIEDAAGLGDTGAKGDEVLCGPGGHQVILIGRQSVVGSDTSGKVVASNPATGTW